MKLVEALAEVERMQTVDSAFIAIANWKVARAFNAIIRGLFT